MSDGLFDESSAAGIAQAAEASTLALLRRAEGASRAAGSSATAAETARAAISDMLTTVGVPHRWTGTVLQLRFPDGTYGEGVDLKGDDGDPGPAPTFIVGAVGNGAAPLFEIHPDASTPNRYIIDVTLQRGAPGLDGTNGINGTNGYAPILAAEADGERRVLRVIDWTGGTGTKPATGAYLAPSGFVATAAAGMDIRGASGAGTGDLSGPASSSDGEVMLYNGTTGKSAKRSNAVPSAWGLARIADADQAANRSALGLGSAASLTAGPAAGNVPVLDGGAKLLASVLPALAITDVFPVASQTEMLALVAQRGDVAIRTDQGIAYILKTDDPSQLANWIAIPLPGGVVMQVAGLSGPTISAEQIKAALALAIADVSGLQGALDANTAAITAQADHLFYGF